MWGQCSPHPANSHTEGLMHRGKDCYDVLRDVVKERARQEELKEAGKFKYGCDSPGLSDPEKYTILGEEFGEVGHEVNELFNLRNSGRDIDWSIVKMYREKLRKELIQVAAVAVAWVEGLDAEAAGEKAS